jgi:hypothetical protein
MDCTDSIPLAEVKRADVIPLWRAAMLEIGPAAQTLGAIDRMTRHDNTTFASHRVIAALACLPVRTVRRHVKTLVQASWLLNGGRKGRRTKTLDLPDLRRNLKHLQKWGMLPRWAALLLKKSWAERAVFALVVSRDRLYEKTNDVVLKQYPVVTLAKESGLAFRSINLAKRNLIERGLITIERSRSPDGHGRIRSGADVLLLNPGFRVPKSILDRCAELAANRSAKMATVADVNGPDRPAEVAAGTPQKWPPRGRKSGRSTYSQLLKEPLNGTSEKKPEAFSIEEKKRQLAEQCHAIESADRAERQRQSAG